MVDYIPTEDVVVSSTSYTYALDNNTVYHIGKHAERTHDVHVRNQWMVFSVRTPSELSFSRSGRESKRQGEHDKKSNIQQDSDINLTPQLSCLHGRTP